MWITFTLLNAALQQFRRRRNYLTGLILDILFPKFCVNCQKEGSYLCEDCFSLIDISEKEYYLLKNLNCLYCACSYDHFIVKKLISQFKYQYFKELAKPVSSLIITYLINLDKVQELKDFILISIPLHKKKLKERGFNQAEELARELSQFLKTPFLNNVLIKIKETPAQVELKKEERAKNVKGSFFCQKPELIRGRKILLVDDVFTTGATLEEAAAGLQSAGAGEVRAVVVAHG